MIAEASQFVLVIAWALILAYFLGGYLTRLITGRPRMFEAFLSRIERPVFRIMGIDPTRSMTWKEYLFALLSMNALVGLFSFVVLLAQGVLPLNPTGVPGTSPDLAFHTATSFATNTDLQHYAGEASLSLFSQLSLMVPMFIAPGTAIAAGIAFIRALPTSTGKIGNFYVDLTRVVLTILLPVSVVVAILLNSQGVPQTLNGLLTTGSFEGASQSIPIGPVASWESIKMFGQNGGGFFGANSAHPFENPNGVTNLLEVIFLLAVPLSFPMAYGKVLGRGRGLAFLAVILASFFLLFGFALLGGGVPIGQETRFEGFGSLLFQQSSIGANTGATNALLESLSHRATTSLFVFMFIQAVPGGAGAGFMTLVIYAILTLFLVGLMVGKTPEFIGIKISPRQVRLAVITFLVHPVLILIPTAIAFVYGHVQGILGTPTTPFGYTQALYEFTSSAANNGSDFLGTLANTPFWNIATGIVMVLGRYVPMGLMLAIAGEFSTQGARGTPEPIRTDGLPFTVTLFGLTFLLSALAFLPFLVIGPFIR